MSNGQTFQDIVNQYVEKVEGPAKAEPKATPKPKPRKKVAQKQGMILLSKLWEIKPDAMTLDLVMPEFDGLYALRGIMDQDPEAKVLVVSALDQQSVLKNAIRLGASDFIVEPFEKDRLVGALEKLMGTG